MFFEAFRSSFEVFHSKRDKITEVDLKNFPNVFRSSFEVFPSKRDRITEVAQNDNLIVALGDELLSKI